MTTADITPRDELDQLVQKILSLPEEVEQAAIKALEQLLTQNKQQEQTI